MRGLILLALPFLALPAAAQPLRASYEVHAAGFTVLELDLVLEMREGGYRLRTVLRTRGMAASIVPGEQVTVVEGAWQGAGARPATYRADGVWRGRERRIALDWAGADPVTRALVPPNEEEREEVAPELRRGTVDALSAMAILARQVQQGGRCDAAARVFDGRRLSAYAAETQSQDLVRPWRNAWHGPALRCGFEARQIAGFRRDQSREDAAAPQRGTAWMAAPFAGAPPIPVRVDIPTRWFGTATAVLTRAEPLSAEQARQ